MKSADSMPLRKAKIGLEAALRRVTKALKAAEAETMKATHARKEAETVSTTSYDSYYSFKFY